MDKESNIREICCKTCTLFVAIKVATYTVVYSSAGSCRTECVSSNDEEGDEEDGEPSSDEDVLNVGGEVEGEVEVRVVGIGAHVDAKPAGDEDESAHMHSVSMRVQFLLALLQKRSTKN